MGLEIETFIDWIYSVHSPPPPTPPARTTSSLPRPDRPAEPPRVFPRHQRNASDGGIIDALKSGGKQQQLPAFQQHPKSKKLDACEEFSESRAPPITNQ